MKKAILFFCLAAFTSRAQTQWLVPDDGQARLRSMLSALTNSGRVLDVQVYLPDDGDRANDLSQWMETLVKRTGHNWLEPHLGVDQGRSRLEFGLASTNDAAVSNLTWQIAMECGVANPRYNTGYSSNTLVISFGRSFIRAGNVEGVRNWSGTTGNNLTPANTTIYYALNGNSITNVFTSDTTCVTRSLMTRSTTLQNLFVQLSAGPGASRITSITVMTNGVASPIVANVQGANTAGSNTVNSVTVAAGAEVGIRIGTVASATTAKISWALEGR